VKLHYYSERDSLYVEFNEKPGDQTREISQRLNIDFDDQGCVVGIDTDHAFKILDLFRLETEALPIQSLAAG